MAYILIVIALRICLFRFSSVDYIIHAYRSVVNINILNLQVAGAGKSNLHVLARALLCIVR